MICICCKNELNPTDLMYQTTDGYLCKPCLFSKPFYDPQRREKRVNRGVAWDKGHIVCQKCGDAVAKDDGYIGVGGSHPVIRENIGVLPKYYHRGCFEGLPPEWRG